jgi:ADP-heptose:LPS heptosyltransferase
MAQLKIGSSRDAALVTVADTLLWPIGVTRRVWRRRPSAPPRQVLCLRLERLGDLVMTLPALAELRARIPAAAIDLVVGSWNETLAKTIPGIRHVDVVDANWLARDGGGQSLEALLLHAIGWRQRGYDLAINFEPDIRSNLLLAASGAAWTAGFISGGGGPLLDTRLDYDTSRHTTVNAVNLVQSLFPRETTKAAAESTVTLPESARAEAATLLDPIKGTVAIGIHVGAGREIKQWPIDRFRDVATVLQQRGAALVFTGSAEDRAMVDGVTAHLPAHAVLDLVGRADVGVLAAVIARLDLLLTVDTGPMHLASAVGTPVVAIFGPSDPARYAPTGPRDRVVRVDLPCSPCNRIRQPPARCVGHTPDCLRGVTATDVLQAVDAVLWPDRIPAAASARP